MQKILFVTNDAWFFASHRLPIAKSYLELGGSCVVAAKKDETVATIVDNGCEFDEWNISPRGKSIYSELRAFYALAKIIVRHKPDIIHLVTIKPVLYGGILSRLLNVKCCVYAISGLGHVLRSHSFYAILIRAIINPLYKFSVRHRNSVVIFQNPDDRLLFIRRYGHKKIKTEMIKGSGVNLNYFPLKKEPTNAITVTMASRLIKEKGVSEFVTAATILKTEGVEARFIVVGGNVAIGNPGAFSKKDMNDLISNDNVEFKGYCNDIPGMFTNSNIVVLPSYYYEGLPKVLIEAAAAARPVITTDMPGCRDAIIDGVTGILVPPKDIDALANAMRKLINNKDLRIKMGNEGRKMVEKEMSIELVVQQHLDIYKYLLNTPNEK